MDNNSVKKVLTFKSGNFVFSRKFRAEDLAGLLAESHAIYRAVADLPVLPGWAAVLEEDLIRRSIFGTAALEGNPLKEAEVAEIISDPPSQKKKEQAETEIRNLREAYRFITEMDITRDQPFALDEALVKKIHAAVTTGLRYDRNVPGAYRNHKVQVGDADHGGVYTPPKCLPDIESLMREFTVWLNSTEMKGLDPLLRAALSHYHLALIHPFGNGNGRTARILEAMFMKASGIKYVPIMLSNCYYRHMDDYFAAFSITRKDKDHDVTHFLKFVLEGVKESVNEIRERITRMVRQLVVRHHISALRTSKHLTQRQFDLLRLLLETPTPFTLRDLSVALPFRALYSNVSERTARRDVEKLADMKLLTQADNKFGLNLNCLD